MKIVEIARATHEINRAYCAALGDLSHKPWDQTSEEIQASVISGVNYILGSPNAKPEDSHRSWANFKKSNGWVYGKVKDEKEKTHPNLVEYEDLPFTEKAKDTIFSTVVKALASAKP